MYGRHRLILFLVDLMIFVWEWWKKVKKKKTGLTRINRSLPYYSDYRVGGCPLAGFEIVQSAVTQTLFRRCANSRTLILSTFVVSLPFRCVSVQMGYFPFCPWRSAFRHYLHLTPSSIQMDSPWTMDNTLAMKFHTVRAGGSKQTFQRPTKRRK